MNFRRSALRAMFICHEKVRLSSRPAAMAAGAAFAVALLGGGAVNALAAPASVTSAPDTASAGSSTTSVVAVAAGTQYTVRAGQSLNDVAIAITQSRDRAVLARATRALFDTNPAAFMNHDPSRMRVGAVLIVPALDASGALSASSTGAATGASESTAAAPASAPTAAPAAVAASTASAASAAAQATTPAASEVSGAASAAVTTGASAGGVASSAPAAGSAPVAASDTQEWTGSIQPAASAPAGQAPSAPTATAPAAAAAQAASQPRQQVSSLQQLLALKNRVLMELQKHGIGGVPVASGPKPTSSAQPAVAGSAATAPAAPQHANAATSPTNEGGLSQRDLSIAAAVGAALIVLLAALRMGRRKRDKEAAARAAEATDAAVAGSARDADSSNGSAVAGQAAVKEASDAREQELARQAAAAAAAEHAAAEREAAQRAAAESAAAERAAAEQAAAETAAAEQAAEERAAAERATAEEQAAAERAAAERAVAEQEAARVAAEHAEAERTAAERIASERAAEEQAARQAGTPEHTAPTAPLAGIPLSGESEPSSEPPAIAPAADETLHSAATAANLAAAAELGADALPLGPLAPVIGATQDEDAHRVQWDEESPESPTADKATGATTTPSPTETPSTAPHTATAEPQSPLNVPPPVIDFPQHQIEPRAPTSLGQPFSNIPVPAQPAPTEFPRDAVDAFGSLNMPLPPRIEVPTVGEAEPPKSLSTQPVASPDTTAQQAFGVHGADDAPHIADQIAAGTAGHGAVAGLGAAGFGALKLDFDLELPPSPAQPLPAFTQADLARIARNKLELASEYIELGDLGGARALINEVIEANDPATRAEARALLSTLAPLS
ncbi:FimV/HubP family polar landmark protein [Paraburkholderia atlantica]|uniref:FimV/HubP family polar landmark protein n=1 Tax=Paraburkholderia atlantica TaxID=2654982 RepID=UPI0016153583|nr:FimV/HubP family polar landmark protein [Paraburkholderia atlantica]MBB5505447.1 FimV-like protein [Paraburkholderia atlantica]